MDNGKTGFEVQERRSRILEELKRNNLVRVVELSKQFGVSTVSIRRDLQELEEMGLLKRVAGGAVNILPNNLTPPLAQRMNQNIEKKERIGRAAASLVKPNDRLIIDSGTTTLQVAKNIANRIDELQSLSVITGFLPVVRELGNCKGVHMILLGGIYLAEYDLVVGPQTIEQLKGLHADRMFLGTDGLTFQQGLTTANVLEAEVARAMVRAASEVIVVTDSSKIGVIGLATIMPIEMMHVLITDLDAPPEFVVSLQERGVDVILV
ncbi:MAG: Regulatory protein, DeoR [Anaerolineae bacterium]|jgi:DeoR/GlpR family transcriptional regulator of sugar metabolism|nr:MAG: Regulatory protein, DeoR [Anaerolineae bacterium]